jgi:hypothetical protein
MKFNLLFLLPLTLTVSAGLVGRGDYGGYGYKTECPTVTVYVTTTAYETATVTTTATTTATTTKTETVTVKTCEKQYYPKETYYAS